MYCTHETGKCNTADVHWSDLTYGEKLAFATGLGVTLTITGLVMPYASGAASILYLK